ncbi:polysaccharide pyruvyl transferase family protein [Alteromonas sp.]|uniref:polysaccharide pyruvyl transferase family protein n=1 Tax=Alteromonas sp. TaxID=232 RepID=UPI00257CB895|nr:polysaccharide pyruvyl transferase family protein [Alteromonas sp.]NQY17009.1 polysaccharide pyruvyl transferase family protein [Alteromonas sp.]
MKIIIFNVKYSDNLGDGVIAECIEKTLESSFKNCTVKSVDMSGRENFGTVGAISSISSSNFILSVLRIFYNVLPSLVKEKLFVRVSAKIIEKHLKPRWAQEVESSDIVIIGGGQIFSDKLLYFPLRLSQLSKVLKAKSKPAAIYGVGVNENFDKKSLRLFTSLTNYKNLFFVSVRDKDSRHSWERNFDKIEPRFTRDPALLVADVYKESIDKNDSTYDTKVIGISVMQNKGKAGLLSNEELYYELGLKLGKMRLSPRCEIIAV